MTESPNARGDATVSSSQRIAAEPAPLIRLKASGFRNVSLTQHGPDVLRFAPNIQARLMGIVFLVFALFVAVPVVAWHPDGFASFQNTPKLFGIWCMCLFSLPLFLVWGIYTLATGGIRFWFDRKSGWLSCGVLRQERICPLGKIAAVQVISGGRHVALGKTTPFPTFQINLILANPLEGKGELMDAFLNILKSSGFPSPTLRVAITHHADCVWTREAGSQLAAFLKVPLLEDPAS